MSSKDDPQPKSAWMRGAVITASGVAIGTLSFAAFCYLLGLNFTDEGLSDNQSSPWQDNRIALLITLAGFSISIVAFWIGVIQITRR